MLNNNSVDNLGLAKNSDTDISKNTYNKGKYRALSTDSYEELPTKKQKLNKGKGKVIYDPQYSDNVL